jgi:hypothetical protein
VFLESPPPTLLIPVSVFAARSRQFLATLPTVGLKNRSTFYVLSPNKTLL